MWILDLLLYLLAFVGTANVIIRLYPEPKADWNKKVYDFVDYLSLRKGVINGRRKK
tara:strand:- start:5036 stop:5203 length:168 start_codon:yes stop_codon:yes gene_type:complete